MAVLQWERRSEDSEYCYYATQIGGIGVSIQHVKEHPAHFNVAVFGANSVVLGRDFTYKTLADAKELAIQMARQAAERTLADADEARLEWTPKELAEQALATCKRLSEKIDAGAYGTMQDWMVSGNRLVLAEGIYIRLHKRYIRRLEALCTVAK